MRRKMALSMMLMVIATLCSNGQAQELSPDNAQAAEQAAGNFIKELGGILKAEMAKGDPAQAIAICRDVAPTIANRLSLENGWRVTRVTSRVRSPMLGMPDAWEQQILQQFQNQLAQGESLAAMSHSEVVEEPEGRYFRYMKPLGVGPLCVTCHGPTEQIPETVTAALQKHYPHDQAVGYQVGELRGAISIKQPLSADTTNSPAH